MKRFTHYFVWFLCIGFICYLGNQYYLNLKYIAQEQFDDKLLFVYSTAFPIIIGMLLKLPLLVKDIKQQKQWTFDWPKFIAIGIPTFSIVSSPAWIYIIWTYTSLGDYSILMNVLNVVTYTPFATVAGVVFGYCLLDVLKR